MKTNKSLSRNEMKNIMGGLETYHPLCPICYDFCVGPNYTQQNCVENPCPVLYDPNNPDPCHPVLIDQ